ncbi:MAG: Gfo/Idh/MocA family oxidoreductase [Myxococcales bacterium]|nr:Gfo/Idh/MocA family oxidoreductase [Myxococcales bacterium]
MSLKVVVVGCGKIADGHVEEIQKLPELAQVVAVCDLEPLMAEQLAERLGVPRFYGDFDQMLEQERPDVVHVTTPPMVHRALAERAMDAGCHVFVEKPLTLSYADSKALVERAVSENKKLGIGYTSYFDPPALVMRELIAEGALGEPVHLESYYGYDLSGAFGKALFGSGDHWVHRLPGKLLHNTIDHMFNKMTEFIDDEEPRILATGYRRRTARYGDLRDALHDELRLIVRGERVSAYGTFSAHAKPMGHFLRVYGTKNTMHLDFVSRTVTFDAQPTLPSAIGRVIPAFAQAARFARQGAQNVWRFAKSEFHFFAGLQELFRRYYRSILDDGDPPIPYSEILRVAWMLDETWAQLAAEDAAMEQP